MKLPSSDAMRSAAVLVGVLAAAFVGWKLYQLARAGADQAGELVTHDLNPASPDNVVYRGIGAVGHATGVIDDGNSLGTQIYENTHNEDGSFSLTETLKHTPIGWIMTGAWDEATALLDGATKH